MVFYFSGSLCFNPTRRTIDVRTQSTREEEASTAFRTFNRSKDKGLEGPRAVPEEKKRRSIIAIDLEELEQSLGFRENRLTDPTIGQSSLPTGKCLQ